MQEAITTLKERITQSDLKTAVSENLDVINMLLVIGNIKVSQLSTRLGVSLPSLRTYLSQCDFKKDVSILDDIVIGLYTSGYTQEQVRRLFNYNFERLQKVLAPVKRKRGNDLTKHLTIDHIRDLFRKSLTLEEAAGELDLSKAQLQKWILNQRYQYNIDSLFGNEIREMYIARNMTVLQISKHFNVTPGNIKQVLDKRNVKKSKAARTRSLVKQTQQTYGVDYYAQLPEMVEKSRRRKKHHHLPQLCSKAFLEEEILKKGKSLKQIAREQRTNDYLISQYCERFNIPYESKEQRADRIKREAANRFTLKSREIWNDRFEYETEYTDASTKIRIKCKEHDHVFEQIPGNHLRANGCKFCQPSGYSCGEKEIVDFIRAIYHGPVIENDRTQISPRELDIYIPEHELAIEYNGIYWHSSNTKNDTYNKIRHLQKTDDCEKRNITLLHVFEHEWSDNVKREIWKSVITGHLGQHTDKIHARKTQIVQVPREQADQFCEYNHLQGACRHTIAYGLIYEGELVCVATFGPARFNKDKETWELIRFCSLLNTRVPGGMSKLLKYFAKTHQRPLLSYANRRWSSGGAYETLSMVRVRTTPPNYFYTADCKTLETRNKYQKHKLSKLLDDFNPNITEQENMFNNGFRQIFDCGNIVYQMT